MIEPQAVGVRVILSCELLIVDLRELKRCKQKHESSKIMCTFFMDVLPHTLGLHDPPDRLRCVLTLSRPREQHLGLQPDRPVSVHHRGGRGVRQTHEILPLLLLNAARGQTDTSSWDLAQRPQRPVGRLTHGARHLPCGCPAEWRICEPPAEAPSLPPSSPPPSWLLGWPATGSCKQTRNCTHKHTHVQTSEHNVSRKSKDTWRVVYPFHAHRSTTMKPWSS